MAPVIKPNDNIGGLYGELTRADIVTPIAGMFGAGWTLDDDGVARPISKSAIDTSTPWIHPVPGKDKDCGLWHHIIFDSYHILPSPCMECWKVVVAPRNLTELFGLLDFESGITGNRQPGSGEERGCGHPCKCGIEVRPYTPRLYGGYFYNSSLDEGQECYQWVRREINGLFDKDLKVILKRACTEFELAFGPSNKWVIPEGQLDREAEIMDLFDRRSIDNPPKQPSNLTPAIQKRWIQWASQNGDETYLNYTNGEPLYDKAVTYQDLDLSKVSTKKVEVHG